MVFLDLIWVGFCSTIACTGHFSLFDITFILLLTIDVIWLMKLDQTSFLIVKWYWGRIEPGANGMINEISDNFSAMSFIIEVSKLHVWSCVHHFKYFSEVKLLESSDYDIKRSGLGSDYICHYYFNCWLVVFVDFLWRSYGIASWSKEVSHPVLI